jgi:hypothetical protein
VKNSKSIIIELIIVLSLIIITCVIKFQPLQVHSLNPQDSETALLLSSIVKNSQNIDMVQFSSQTGYLPFTTVLLDSFFQNPNENKSLIHIRIVALLLSISLTVLLWGVIKLLCRVQSGVNWYALIATVLFSFHPLVLLYGGIGLSIHILSMLLMLILLVFLLLLWKSVNTSFLMIAITILAAICFGLLALISWWGILASIVGLLYCFRYFKKRLLFGITALSGVATVILSIGINAILFGNGNLLNGVHAFVSIPFRQSTVLNETESLTILVNYVRYINPYVLLGLLILGKFIYSPLPEIKPGRNFINMFSKQQWAAISVQFIATALFLVLFSSLLSLSSSMLLPVIMTMVMLTVFVLHKTIDFSIRSFTAPFFLVLIILVVLWSLIIYFSYITGLIPTFL